MISANFTWTTVTWKLPITFFLSLSHMNPTVLLLPQVWCPGGRGVAGTATLGSTRGSLAISTGYTNTPVTVATVEGEEEGCPGPCWWDDKGFISAPVVLWIVLGVKTCAVTVVSYSVSMESINMFQSCVMWKKKTDVTHLRIIIKSDQCKLRFI